MGWWEWDGMEETGWDVVVVKMAACMPSQGSISTQTTLLPAVDSKCDRNPDSAAALVAYCTRSAASSSACLEGTGGLSR